MHIFKSSTISLHPPILGATSQCYGYPFWGGEASWAWKWPRRSGPTCIISDILMPTMDWLNS